MDYVIMAVGSKLEEGIASANGLELSKYGYIKINEEYQTNIEGVFAGGDAVGENATVAWASRNGRDVANAIDKWLVNM